MIGENAVEVQLVFTKHATIIIFLFIIKIILKGIYYILAPKQMDGIQII